MCTMLCMIVRNMYNCTQLVPRCNSRLYLTQERDLCKFCTSRQRSKSDERCDHVQAALFSTNRQLHWTGLLVSLQLLHWRGCKETRSSLAWWYFVVALAENAHQPSSAWVHRRSHDGESHLAPWLQGRTTNPGAYQVYVHPLTGTLAGVWPQLYHQECCQGVVDCSPSGVGPIPSALISSWQADQCYCHVYSSWSPQRCWQHAQVAAWCHAGDRLQRRSVRLQRDGEQIDWYWWSFPLSRRSRILLISTKTCTTTLFKYYLELLHNAIFV